MKVSYNWIKQYLDLEVPADELAEKIERTAVEVDSVKFPAEGMKKVVVGEVVAMEDHPDSDHLHICQVEIGEDEPTQIVCGAPNVHVGAKVITALSGSRIGNNVKIKKSKMRGIPSNGMLCSLDEMGLDKDLVPDEWSDGIYLFPEDTPVGQPVFPYLGMDDAVIDLDVTPNRGDMLSILGTVHELAAIYDLTPKISKVELIENATTPTNKQINVLADSDLASTFSARVINNVKVTSSPAWLQKILWKSGIKPINTVVDATNYIMLKYGQPINAFDMDRMNGQNMSVRYATKNEKILLENEAEIELTNDDIVIADEVPMALAGVMNGKVVSVDNDTSNIVLGAGVFDPIKVRKSAQRHGLHTESSQRFERGIDISSVNTALDEVASLIVELSDGEVAKGIIEATKLDKPETKINITVQRINHVLGTDLSQTEITSIFDRLGFKVVENENDMTVIVPLRRWDIFVAADLLEEVARIYGYDNLATTLPVGKQTIGSLSSAQRIIRSSRNILEGLGLTQAISYALTTEEKAQMFLMRPSELTRLIWPMTSDREALRMNLISGLLDDIAYNNAHKVQNVALYEQGRVFYKDTKDQVKPTEVEHIAGVISGEMLTSNWDESAVAADFYQLKGIVGRYLNNLSINGEIKYVATDELKEMHPGRTAKILIHDHEVGFIGQIHPKIAKQFKIKPTYAFELNLQALIDLPKADNQYAPISKYPSIKRDIAIVVDDSVTNQQIIDIITKRGGKLLSNIELFDVYNGENVDDGKKSLAYSLTYVNHNDTLKDEDVTNAFDKIKKYLIEELNAEIR